jgi:hypothetical protein
VEVVLHTLVGLIESRVLASDGTCGRVVDAYVDERTWAIECLIVMISGPGGDRHMVCFPDAVTEIDIEEGVITVARLSASSIELAESRDYLRSSRDVIGCNVSGWSGAIGRTEDAIFETDSWELRFLLIDASELCNGAVVLLQPGLIDEVRWEQSSLHAAVTRLEVLSGEEQGTTIPAGRVKQKRLH